MECRETLVVSPLAVSFEAMFISNEEDISIRRQASKQQKRSRSWGGSQQPSSQNDVGAQPLIKIGSGDLGGLKKKIKKQRPSMLVQTKKLDFCVEQMVQRHFNEEEAELATLCLGVASELERLQQTDDSPRCPAPDPIVTQGKEKARRLTLSNFGEAIGSHPFGLRPRMKRKKLARVFPPPDFAETSDEEDSSGTEEEANSSLVLSSPPVSTKHSHSASLRRCQSMGSGLTPSSSTNNPSVDIPLLDFAKLRVLRDIAGSGGPVLLSPHASPPRSPSSPTTMSKPDSARYNRIEGSPRSAFVKPSTS